MRRLSGRGRNRGLPDGVVRHVDDKFVGSVMVRLAGMAVVVLVLGAGTACGSTTSGSGEEAAADPTSLSRTPPPTQSRPPARPKSPSDQLRPRTVRGTVVRGAEPGCVELVSSSARWVLLGAAAQDLVDGDEVEVVGRPAPQLPTSCDGVPLQVRAVRQL